MKNIIVTDSEIQLTKTDIENVEVELKVKLPKDLKMFLLKYNGGHPSKDGYPLIEIFDFNRYGWGNSTVSDCGISWFYAIYDGEYNNFVKENLHKLDRGIADDLVIIGCSPGGDEICIGVKQDNFGKIYYWGHDWERGEGCLSFVLVANNFIDFINSLYQSEIETEETTSGAIRATSCTFIHDRYSLPFSTEAKKHGEVVTTFFLEAPKEVEDYIIEETESTKDLLLWYEVKSKNTRYYRKISKEGQINDYQVKGN
jgi:cell wall assembly regulator SMI1